MINDTLNGDDGWTSFFGYVIYLIEGLVIGVGNFVIVVTIVRFSALREAKEYLMVMGLSIADGIQLLGLFVAGLYRITLVIRGTHNEFKTPWQCATIPHNIIWSFSTPASSLMLLVISIDRFLAVYFPLKYLKLTRRYTLSILSASSIYCLATGTVMYLSVVYHSRNLTEIRGITVAAKCLQVLPLKVGGTNLALWYANYFMYAPTVFMFASIVGYIAVWLVYKKSMVQVGPDGQNDDTTRNITQQRRLTVSLGLSCLCTLFVSMIPYSIVRLTIGIVPDQIRILLYAMTYLNPLCNVFIYSLRHHEMKEGIMALFTGKQMPNNLVAWQRNREASRKKARTRSKPKDNNII